MAASKDVLMQKREKAIKLAKKARKLEPNPCKKIPPSLLSAKHIKTYVRETGLIWPFCFGDGGKSRLKKASYEGKIGEYAYKYEVDSKEPVSIFFDGNLLIVPANSIVFVECDLEFRLPNNIAVRFNLQINHVHRGLLLGTGPLIDPGYWGKLCIPLHNLTDEDYSIDLDEGLIWVEFTKTTSNSDVGRNALKSLKSAEHWDILKFLKKASHNKDNPRVGIRSSISTVIDDTGKAKKTANEAKNIAEKTKKEFYRFGLTGLVLAFFGLIYFLSSVIQATYEQVDETRRLLDEKLISQEAEISKIKNRIANNPDLDYFELWSRYEELQERLAKIESAEERSNSLSKEKIAE